jgi:hypothetical protein
MATPVVPSIGIVSERWARRASNASPDYQKGVETTTRDWAIAAGAAENSYKQAVTAAATAGRFGKGVAKAGTQKWKKRAASVGPERYASGVQVAQPEYSGGFAPFLEAIGRVDLPARGPRGAAANYGRVQPIGAALNALKNRG